MTGKARGMANRVAAAAGRIAAAVALAAAVAGAQQAAPTSAPAPTKAPKGWWRQPKVVSQLELTAAQQAAIDAAESSHRAARSAATKVYSRAYAGLMAALSADPVDQASLEAQRRTFLAAWGELGKASADRLVALRGILSARQLEQLPKVAPGALRSGPVAVRALGEVGAAAPAAQP